MSDHKNKIIIKSAPLSKANNKIHLADSGFISLIEYDIQNVIFQYIKTNSENIKKHRFYIVKEGFCFLTKSTHLESFQKYYDTVKLAMDKGFDYLKYYFDSLDYEIETAQDYHDFHESNFNLNYEDIDYSDIEEGEFKKHIFKVFVDARNKGFRKVKEYVMARNLGIDNYMGYEEFLDSGFTSSYNGVEEMKENYKRFLKVKERGFVNIDNYELAEELEINNFQELELFLKSEFYDSDNYPSADYEEFKKAKKAGFYVKDMYYKAKDLGFDKYDKYKKFLDSGCETVEDYQFKIKFPPVLKEKSKKIEEILLDANKAYDSMRYEEFFRLKYLSVEKMAEITYMKQFKKELNKDNELKFDDIIVALNKKSEKKLVDLKELRYWRRLRNKVIHEHHKLDIESVKQGKEFLEELFNNLDN